MLEVPQHGVLCLQHAFLHALIAIVGARCARRAVVVVARIEVDRALADVAAVHDNVTPRARKRASIDGVPVEHASFDITIDGMRHRSVLIVAGAGAHHVKVRATFPSTEDETGEQTVHAFAARVISSAVMHPEALPWFDAGQIFDEQLPQPKPNAPRPPVRTARY